VHHPRSFNTLHIWKFSLRVKAHSFFISWKGVNWNVRGSVIVKLSLTFLSICAGQLIVSSCTLITTVLMDHLSLVEGFCSFCTTFLCLRSVPFAPLPVSLMSPFALLSVPMSACSVSVS